MNFLNWSFKRRDVVILFDDEGIPSVSIGCLFTNLKPYKKSIVSPWGFFLFVVVKEKSESFFIQRNAISEQTFRSFIRFNKWHKWK